VTRSIRFGQIFKPPVIAIPRWGILHLHSGLLPGYRGVLAIFWAMLKRELRSGCTLHYVADATIDTGPILGTHSVPADGQSSLV
jgi:methionyl-tRNA formyltransferase